MPTDEPRAELRSFGRRRGRKLSMSQEALLSEALPRLAIDTASPAPPDLASLFANPVEDVWLEIGFGGGEHLTWQARQHLNVGFIGAEPFRDGIVKLLGVVSAAAQSNVRIYPEDARDLLRWLPPASVGRAFILFPDPWPKRKHLKRRLVSAATLALLARCMRPGAELRIATDIGSYAAAILRAIRAQGAFAWQAASPLDWRVRPPDWPQTRYEQKALQAGRRSYYFRFLRA